MSEHALVCPNCKSGLIVDVGQAVGGAIAETVKIVHISTPEAMAAAAADQLAGRKAAEEAADALRAANAKIEASSLAAGLSTLVARSEAVPVPEAEEGPAVVGEVPAAVESEGDGA